MVVSFIICFTTRVIGVSVVVGYDACFGTIMSDRMPRERRPVTARARISLFALWQSAVMTWRDVVRRRRIMTATLARFITAVSIHVIAVIRWSLPALSISISRQGLSSRLEWRHVISHVTPPIRHARSLVGRRRHYVIVTPLVTTLRRHCHYRSRRQYYVVRRHAAASYGHIALLSYREQATFNTEAMRHRHYHNGIIALRQ